MAKLGTKRILVCAINKHSGYVGKVGKALQAAAKK
jgi:hypothetical protein